jgi:hypothetical protein
MTLFYSQNYSDKGVEKKVVVEGLGEKDIQERLVKALQQ